ncbi:hypothetical protein HYFRA_00009503 [Hymenoscyphus fraxineus]|uniref:Uncharacterized protein n=1 Tax=Hymenoscyphus fraxineus TaxID=746836 RepID=A0A9N9PJA0_9HELO|nr:hypothetical protein HYFRA_00009503 [Hymenoscyphus fraxineus]
MYFCVERAPVMSKRVPDMLCSWVAGRERELDLMGMGTRSEVPALPGANAFGRTTYHYSMACIQNAHTHCINAGYIAILMATSETV